MKTSNSKSVMNASIWVVYISKYSDMLEEVEHSLFNSPFILRRYGFPLRSTDLADKPHS